MNNEKKNPKEFCAEHLERCLSTELKDDLHCVEIRADKMAEQWAEAGRIARVFNTCLAREHSKWVLKHDKGLKERYLSAKKAKAA